MPRRKPDTVNVTRVELGPWEREHIGPYLQAQASKPYLDFMSQIMRDVSAILLIAGFFTLLLPGWLPADWRETLGMSDDPVGLRATLRDWFEIQNLVGFTAGAWGGFTATAWSGLFTGGWSTLVGTLLGGLAGWTAVEVGEEVVEAVQEAQAEAVLAAQAENQTDAEITWTAVLIRIVLVLEKVGNRTGPL